jgi:DNA-binding XRE family transcriptional regulator
VRQTKAKEVIVMDSLKISLAAARVNAKMTQDDVSKALGVTKQTVVNWENGRSEPSVSQGLKLSDIYKMPFDTIFFLKE